MIMLNLKFTNQHVTLPYSYSNRMKGLDLPKVCHKRNARLAAISETRKVMTLRFAVGGKMPIFFE